ncbi:MAG: nucleoside deaminase [Bacteroidota bacterium]
MNDHEHYMRECLVLARKALERGNPPVGSLIVQNGKVIGLGIESGKEKKDITYHAEIEALRDAVRNTGQKDLSDCTLYTSHEPCIMCSYVIRHHRVKTVVMGSTVPSIGGASSNYPILTAHDIDIWPSPPEVIDGVLTKECEDLTAEFKRSI